MTPERLPGIGVRSRLSVSTAAMTSRVVVIGTPARGCMTSQGVRVKISDCDHACSCSQRLMSSLRRQRNNSLDVAMETLNGVITVLGTAWQGRCRSETLYLIVVILLLVLILR